jgi:hypothetical protein
MGLGLDEAKEKELKVEREVDSSYSTLRIIWLGALSVLIIILIVTRLVQPQAVGLKSLFWILLALGLLDLGASFILKQALLKKAFAQEKVALARSAYIVAFALCEAIGLFGFVAHFVTGVEQYYFFFVLSGFGLLLHKPERNDLLMALGGYKI